MVGIAEAVELTSGLDEDRLLIDADWLVESADDVAEDDEGVIVPDNEFESVLDSPYTGGVGAGMDELLVRLLLVIDEDAELDSVEPAVDDDESDIVLEAP